jgi:hypothetical protein
MSANIMSATLNPTETEDLAPSKLKGEITWPAMLSMETKEPE